jgi:hypothetical protein
MQFASLFSSASRAERVRASLVRIGSRAGAAVLVAGVTVATALSGCGGDDSAPVRNAGGAASVGGSSSTGGAPACDIPTAPQTCAHQMAPKPVVVDFSTFNGGNWGNMSAGDLTGGTHPYAAEGVAVLNRSLQGGMLKVTGSLPQGSYAGLVFWFGPCVDLSTIADGTTGSGLRIVMGGSVGGATLKLQVQSETNYPVDTANTKGSCMFTDCATRWDVCKPPTATIPTVPAAPDTAAPIELSWGAFTGGSPNDTTDGIGVVGLQFQWECPSGDVACEIDVTLGSISLLP